ncbi:hypothetical protein [Moraxella lacunata]|uniref:hypothetical protein n=1 Tax=Moraxella lacunata TaxID=477 RepID=UPI003EE0B1ED
MVCTLLFNRIYDYKMAKKQNHKLGGVCGFIGVLLLALSIRASIISAVFHVGLSICHILADGCIMPKSSP